MIQITDINKSFGSLRVLSNVSMRIDKGEVVSIVGPSGAGKTTLLQIVGTLDKPDSGQVLIDGNDVTRLTGDALAAFRGSHIGFVFQFHQLLPEFTAVENVMMPALLSGISMKRAKNDALGLLDTVGLAHRANHKPNQLSGGEKQRVAVARALINRPAVVLADEPSGSLDSVGRVALHNMLLDLRNRFGQTFLIVTHDEHMAEVSDRVVRMLDGKICQ